jgi:hypothetical protein
MSAMRHLTAAAALALAAAAILPIGDARANAGDAPDLFVLTLPTTPGEGARLVPKFRILFPPATRWREPLRWYYNPKDAPPPWDGDPAGTVSDLRRALEAWTAVCDVTYVYAGETAIPANNRLQDPRFGEQPDFVNVVGWGPLDGNTAGVTWAWTGSGPNGAELVDTDIILSTTLVRTATEMKRTGTHEWGHALGLAHSDLYGALMSGPPVTVYNGLTALQTDDVRGCRCLYGAPAAAPAGYVCGTPAKIDFGLVAVGVPSAPRPFTIRNEGNGPLSIVSRTLSTSEVTADPACGAGTVIPPGGSCTTNLAVRPLFATASPMDAIVNLQLSDGAYSVPVAYQGGSSAPPPATTVAVIEYYHAAFDHYFVTHLPDEISKLDNGTFAGWTRTGRSFKAWSASSSGTAPVCRFFSESFAPKSSHFYTSFAAECATVKGNAAWTFEGEVFHVALPDGAGACGAGTQPVYRLYNRGKGSAPNHRFTTDVALQQQMIGQGWDPEGLGAGVTMCAPL